MYKQISEWTFGVSKKFVWQPGLLASLSKKCQILMCQVFLFVEYISGVYILEENNFFSPPPYSEVIFFPQFLFLLKNFCAREARKIFWGGEGRLGKIGKKNEKLWFWNKIREKKWKIITEFQKSCYWKQKKGKKMKDLAASRPWFFIFFPLFQILHFPPPWGGLYFKIYTPV